MLEAATLSTLSSAAAVVARASAATVSAAAKPALTDTSSLLGLTSAGGQVMELFKRGGPFMWPILLTSLIAVVFLFDRLIGLFSEARATRRMLKSLEALASRADIEPEHLEEQFIGCSQSPVAMMGMAGLEKLRAGEYGKIESAMDRAGQAEIGRLERGLPALASVSNIAPLIGFLGTVWGIILAFHVIGLKKVVDPQDVSEGISQALIMSAAGLIVAIPASGAHNFFATRVSNIAVMMHEGAYLLTMLFSIMAGESKGGALAPDAPDDEETDTSSRAGER